jgi:hypothetical protein
MIDHGAHVNPARVAAIILAQPAGTDQIFVDDKIIGIVQQLIVCDVWKPANGVEGRMILRGAAYQQLCRVEHVDAVAKSIENRFL